MIHRFWHGPPRSHSWLDVAVAGWGRTKLWGLSDLEHLDLDPNDDPRHLSNVARYDILHRHGGLWLDCDVIPLVPLGSQRREPWTAAVGDWREGSVLFFPRPAHPMMEACLRMALAAEPAHPSERSGATVLNRVGADFPDVGRVREVLPFDARGLHMGVRQPWAVHLWSSTSGAAHA